MPVQVEVTRSIESSHSAANSRFAAEWWTPRLAGPVIAAAIVRLTLLSAALARVGASSLSQADTMSYLAPGRNLLFHGRFVADGVPDLVRTPGYPLFLAITSLAGLPAAAVANVILSSLSVILVWRLSRTVFDDQRIAIGAAWIFAFEPVSIVFSVILFSETLFLTLFLLSMERIVEFLRGRSLGVLAVSGLWLAAATFVRPVTYYLPIALALGLLALLARVPGLRWKAPAVLLISVMPWLAAWQVRNWVETGYGGFSSIKEVNLYFFIDAGVIAQVEHRHFLEVRKELGYLEFTDRNGQSYLYQPYLAAHPEQTGWSQAQRLTFMQSEALRTIHLHFGVYLRSCFSSLLKTAFNPGAGWFDQVLNPAAPPDSVGIMGQSPARLGIALARQHPRVAVEKAVFEVVLLGMYLLVARALLLVLRGAFRGAMQGTGLWLLLGTTLYFLAISGSAGGPGADVRFRLPVMPAVCILAAAGFPRKTTVVR